MFNLHYCYTTSTPSPENLTRMPHYLRFLKSPTIEYPKDHHSTTKFKRTSTNDTRQQRQAKLRLTFTCQTDLGDAYYAENGTLTAFPTPNSRSSNVEKLSLIVGYSAGYSTISFV